MPSIISRLLTTLFPPAEINVLMLGKDGAGRSVALYWLVLQRHVTSMPTIGANVETVTREGTNLCMRDVGGCDRIRPLWKHYYAGCQVLFFFFDITDFGRFDESMQELAEMLSREELRDTVLCVIANKQDLSTQAGEQAMALGVPQITIEKLRTDLDRVVRDEEARSAPREIFVGGAVATTGEGLEEAVSWMIGAVQRQRALKPSISSSRELLAPAPVTHQDKDGDKKETGIQETKDGDLRQEEERNVLEEWLEREDAPDDDFLDAFARYDLESWDHYTHLRVAWLFLRKHGRREGIRHIFDGIKLFIANSTRTQRSRGTTFHETMTYFWVHMVHFARESATIPAAKIDFKSFLLLNPQLSNGGLFLTYYRNVESYLSSCLRVCISVCIHGVSASWCLQVGVYVCLACLSAWLHVFVCASRCLCAVWSNFSSL